MKQITDYTELKDEKIAIYLIKYPNIFDYRLGTWAEDIQEFWVDGYGSLDFNAKLVIYEILLSELK